MSNEQQRDNSEGISNMTALNNLIDNIYNDMLSDVHEAQGRPINFATDPDFCVDSETPMEPIALTLLDALVESVAFFSQPGIVVTLEAVIDRLRNAHGIDNIERNGRVSDCVALVREGFEVSIIKAHRKDDGDIKSVALTVEGLSIAVERGWAVQTCLRCDDAVRDADVNEDGWCEDCVASYLEAQDIANGTAGMMQRIEQGRADVIDHDSLDDEDVVVAVDVTPLTFGDLNALDFARTQRGGLRMYVRQNGENIIGVYQRKDGSWARSSDKASALATLVVIDDDAPERLAAYAAMTRKDRDALLLTVKPASSEDDEAFPLCEDCVDNIGGAGAGPDAIWRPAAEGEACGAAYCVQDIVADAEYRARLDAEYRDELDARHAAKIAEQDAVNEAIEDESDLHALEQRIEAQDGRIEAQDEVIDQHDGRIIFQGEVVEEVDQRIAYLERNRREDFDTLAAHGQRIIELERRLDAQRRRLDATLDALSKMTAVALSLRQIDHPGFE